MIRVAICEDDHVMLENMTRMVREFSIANPHLGITIHPFASTFDLLDSREKQSAPYHIYLLDVLMPVMSGIELGRYIRKDDDHAVIIYMTSSTEYALESFKASPLQYLVKPIQTGVLHQVLEKACQKLKQYQDQQVLIRVKGGIALVRYNQIAYIEYMNHTMTYHLITGKTLTSMVLRESFTDCTEKYLQDPRFIKPHASFVLNMDYVQVLSSKEFQMQNGETVPISKRSYIMVRRQFMDYVLARHGGIAQ